MKKYKAKLSDLRVSEFYGDRLEAFKIIAQNFESEEFEDIALNPHGLTASFWSFKFAKTRDGKTLAVGSVSPLRKYNEAYAVEIE